MALKNDIGVILDKSKDLTYRIESVLFCIEDQAKQIEYQEAKINKLEEENESLKADIDVLLGDKYGRPTRGGAGSIR